MKNLKSHLDEVYQKYHSIELLKTDPIQFPHRYQDEADQELVAFISALFAFGNVKSICNTMEQVLEPLGPRPSQGLTALTTKELVKLYSRIYYRFFSPQDIGALLQGLRALHQSSKRPLRDLIIASKSQDAIPVLEFLRARLHEAISTRLSPGLKFMFPDPQAGAAKRFHMFLRWMVRKDQIDFGLWADLIPAQNLVIPLDVHLFQICRALHLTHLKSPSLKAALQITAHLKTFDALDPIRYDFALCRIGILGLKGQELKSLKSLRFRPPDARRQKALN